VWFIGSLKSLFYTAIVCFIVGILIGTYLDIGHRPPMQHSDQRLQRWCDEFKCNFDSFERKYHG
jgi:hypothetical protein